MVSFEESDVTSVAVKSGLLDISCGHFDCDTDVGSNCGYETGGGSVAVMDSPPLTARGTLPVCENFGYEAGGGSVAVMDSSPDTARGTHPVGEYFSERSELDLSWPEGDDESVPCIDVVVIDGEFDIVEVDEVTAAAEAVSERSCWVCL